MKEVKRSSRRIRGQEPEFSGLPVKRDLMFKVKAQPRYSGQSRYNDIQSKYETDEVSSTEDYSEDDERVDTHMFESISHISQSSSVREEENRGTSNYTWLFVCSLILALALVLKFMTDTASLFSSFERNDVHKPLQELFPAQNSTLWDIVNYGKSCISPLVLLLVHVKNHKTANCLAKCIARTLAHEKMGSSVRPVLINGTEANFGSDFLDTLKSQMCESHTLVLLDMDHLPPRIAEKLHFVVDPYNPWLPKGVYVLTMEIPKLKAEEKLFTAVSKVLENKWSDISADNLGPLVTRVADTVILVQKDVGSCPSCNNFINFK